MNQPKTIFCDIDGTLLQHHRDIIKNYQECPVPLKNAIENIKQWEKNNYHIILTTGRKECLRQITEEQLHSVGIIYDKLIMGLPNGPRVLINDKKENETQNTAYAINVPRNAGLEHLDLTSTYITVPDNYRSIPYIEKPWGSETLIECNDKYVVKKLFMKAGAACSIQYHECKRETILIFSGELWIYSGPSLEMLEKKLYKAGDTITIEPYTVHRMEGHTDAIYYETSTNELWDVVRLQDNYGRTTAK